MDAEAANAPRRFGREPGYEAWYLTLADAIEGFGLWLRWTALQPPPDSRLTPAAGLWATAFDRRRRPPIAVRQEFPLRELVVSRPFAVAIGDARLDAAGTEGRVAGPAGEVEWHLTFRSLDRAYSFLSPALERFSNTGNTSPHPALLVEGTATVNGRRHRIRGVSGGQGHTWGSRHATAWNWAHAAWPDGGWLTGATSHTGSRLGQEVRATTLGMRVPQIGVRDGGLRLGTSAPRALFQPGDVEPLRWEARRRFGTRDVQVSVVADPADMVVLEYVDPAGDRRLCHHTEFAQLRATVTVAGETEATLEHAGAAFEFGLRPPTAAVDAV